MLSPGSSSATASSAPAASSPVAASSSPPPLSMSPTTVLAPLLCSVSDRDDTQRNDASVHQTVRVGPFRLQRILVQALCTGVKSTHHDHHQRTLSSRRLLFNFLKHLVGHPEILDCVAAHVALRHAPKAVALLRNVINRSFANGTTPSVGFFSGGSPAHVSCERIYWYWQRTFDVHRTSFRCRFIQVSQLIRWPLYVSPFFSSTS